MSITDLCNTYEFFCINLETSNLHSNTIIWLNHRILEESDRIDKFIRRGNQTYIVFLSITWRICTLIVVHISWNTLQEKKGFYSIDQYINRYLHDARWNMLMDQFYKRCPSERMTNEGNLHSIEEKYYFGHLSDDRFDNFVFKWTENNRMIFNWKNHITTSWEGKSNSLKITLRSAKFDFFTRLNFSHTNIIDGSNSNDITVSIEWMDIQWERQCLLLLTCRYICLQLHWITFFELFLSIEDRNIEDEVRFHDPNWPEK